MRIKAHESKRNGRTDWLALKEHYDGVGIHTRSIIEAEAILNDLFYSEKFPHIYFEKFEQRLMHVFTVYAKVAKVPMSIHRK